MATNLVLMRHGSVCVYVVVSDRRFMMKKQMNKDAADATICVNIGIRTHTFTPLTIIVMAALCFPGSAH